MRNAARGEGSLPLSPEPGPVSPQVFREQAIDGETLPLLTEEHLLNNMGLKLGPALKIRSQVGAVPLPGGTKGHTVRLSPAGAGLVTVIFRVIIVQLFNLGFRSACAGLQKWCVCSSISQAALPGQTARK